MSEIAQNIKQIEGRIQLAAARSPRAAEKVRLIAVTKTVDTARINEAIAGGAEILGENRVQEIVEKYDAISPRRPIHLIGHLQTNKVKYIIDKVELIHSVDRIELAKEIEKRAERINKIQEVLIQVNISGEESKFGISPPECKGLCEAVDAMPHIKVKGFMTIAPKTEDIPLLRSVFGGLRELAASIAKEGFQHIETTELSMGMTHDFEIAVEEGATMVRVGTGIFGQRI